MESNVSVPYAELTPSNGPINSDAFAKAVKVERGPEPIDPVVPAASIAAVEDAKVFAAAVVHPEPVEDVAVPDEPAFPVSSMLDAATLTKIVDSPELAEALAEEGLVIDKAEIARAIEQDKERAKLEAIVYPSAATFDYPAAPPAEELVEVTPETFRDLKIAVNASFEELASLVLEQQRQLDEIEARLSAFNKRGGHKI